MIAIKNCNYGKSKHERNFMIKITNFDTAYISKKIMTSGKNQRLSGTESRVHVNELYTRDSQWQKLTYLVPPKTCHVIDIDVSCHPHIRFSNVAH